MTEEEKNSYWFYQIETRLKLNVNNWADRYEFITNTNQWCILKDINHNWFGLFHCCITNQGPKLIKLNGITCLGCGTEVPEEIEITLGIMKWY